MSVTSTISPFSSWPTPRTLSSFASRLSLSAAPPGMIFWMTVSPSGVACSEAPDPVEGQLHLNVEIGGRVGRHVTGVRIVSRCQRGQVTLEQLDVVGLTPAFQQRVIAARQPFPAESACRRPICRRLLCGRPRVRRPCRQTRGRCRWQRRRRPRHRRKPCLSFRRRLLASAALAFSPSRSYLTRFRHRSRTSASVRAKTAASGSMTMFSSAEKSCFSFTNSSTIFTRWSSRTKNR